ncbi:MAG: radical SAM protein [Caldisericia bacterium]|nr:radical SAM protein [Caldisericia bacterium]
MRRLLWDITAKCNLQCRHCYNAYRYSQTQDELSYEECIDAIDKIKRAKIPAINFLGGEPFYRKDFLKIVEYARNKGLVVLIATNSTLIDEHSAAHIIDLGVTSISVSIDGISPITNDRVRGQGSFIAAMKGLNKLLFASQKDSSKTKVGINFTVSGINILDLDNLVDFAHETGVESSFSLYTEESNQIRFS